MLGNLKNVGAAAGNTVSAASNAMKLKSQQEKLQKLLASIRVTGVSKNGKVTVTITGEQKIVEINIDPALIKFVYENFTSQDKPDTMMSRAIVEAVDDAVSKVQMEVVKKMQETGSLEDLMSMLQTAGSMGMGTPGAN
jgi:DNA-binding protein YbaB